MAFKKKARRVYRSVRKFSRRHKTTSSVGSDLIAGAVVGVGSNFLLPMVRPYVQPLLANVPVPVSSDSLILLGGGIAAKKFLHKGGKFADAAIILGAAMAANQLMAGVGQGNNSAGGGY